MLLLVALLCTYCSIAVAKRGRRIDIYHQKSSDITQLKPSSSIWGKMRNALPTNSLNRWSEYRDLTKNYVIPFEITGDFDLEERSIILGAMRALERNTCIRFKRRDGERDFVDIQNEEDEGCYTSVGRSRGRNVVMLEANNRATCVEHDIVIHELLHTIGLWHEHMRYDRDEFITVHYDRIAPAFFSQFEKISKLESTAYNVEYDYTSVMHYAKDSFAEVPGDVTMQTKDSAFADVIGKVLDASPSDYIKVCSIYKCGMCMGIPFKRKEMSTTPSSTPPPSLNRRFTTAAPRPRSTHRPLKKPKDCEDSFFCPRVLTPGGCESTRLKRWCCASCSSSGFH